MRNRGDADGARASIHVPAEWDDDPKEHVQTQEAKEGKFAMEPKLAQPDTMDGLSIGSTFSAFFSTSRVLQRACDVAGACDLVQLCPGRFENKFIKLLFCFTHTHTKDVSILCIVVALRTVHTSEEVQFDTHTHACEPN